MIDRIDDAPLDDDLAARFARLDRLDAPDNWERASALAGNSERGGGSGQRWWVAAAAAVLVVGGVVAVAATNGDAPLQDAATSVAPITSASDPAVPVPASDVDGGVDTSDFGSATVEPGSGAPGDRVTVTPNGVIQPTCTDLGAIFSLNDRTPVRVGIVGQDGLWVPEDQRPTIPACLPPETAESMTYVIPENAAAGFVSICRATDFSDDACGSLEIVEAPTDEAASIVVPVVEGLTEGEAVDTLRSLGLTVAIERLEVEPGSPSVGRVISQDPPGASPVQIGDLVSVVVGVAPGTAADELALTLARFGVDLGTAPAGATTLDGATFCGAEQTGLEGFRSDDIDVDGRRCLLDHHAARLPAVFVSGSSTDEGDPIVVVTRTRADGTASEFVDSTLDAFGSGEWSTADCGLPKGRSDSPIAFGCSDGDVSLTEAIAIEPLAFPAWFGRRTGAPTCGYISTSVDDSAALDDAQPLACMTAAIDNGETAELVTVHVGDDIRVARWIVSIGPSPTGIDQFEVASLVVDLRSDTTRWAENRCVEGELVDGRLVGDFIVGREFVDQLDPSGTIVTENGDVLIEPGPDARNQLQACNGPLRVERPFVTPFEATGQRIGDVGPRAARFPGFNEVGEYDITIARSWEPVATSDNPGIVGFIPNDSLEFPPPPDSGDAFEPDRSIYADDGATRIGEFGPDGSVILDP